LVARRLCRLPSECHRKRPHRGDLAVRANNGLMHRINDEAANDAAYAAIRRENLLLLMQQRVVGVSVSDRSFNFS
jgi:hypothetical protein